MNPLARNAPAQPTPPRRSRAWPVISLVLACAVAAAVWGGVSLWAGVDAARQEFKDYVSPAIQKYNAAIAELTAAQRAYLITHSKEDILALIRATDEVLVAACPQIYEKSEFYSAEDARLVTAAYQRSLAENGGAPGNPTLGSQLAAIVYAAKRVCSLDGEDMFLFPRPGAFDPARKLLYGRGIERCEARHSAFECRRALTPSWVNALL